MAVGDFLTGYETALRFLHVLAGIVWIGMLYFFNLVNLPLLKFQLKKPYEFSMAEKATAHITGKTLFWFRWGAVFTVVFGLLLAWERQISAGTASAAYGIRTATGELIWGNIAIDLGMILALVMAFNVWFIIWPRQQKILGNNKSIAAATDEAEKKRLGDLNAPMVKTAVLASRINTWLSVPMLWGMIFGAHGTTNWNQALLILAIVLVLMWAFSSSKPKKATA